MEEKYFEISAEDLKKFVDSMIKDNFEIIAPMNRDGDTFYGKIGKFDDANLDTLLPKMSYKEYLLPKTEALFEYSFSGVDIDIKDGIESVEGENLKRVIFGGRPCEAAAGPIMEKVFNWGYKDDFFNERFKNLTIVSIACEKPDDYCFCAEMQLSPESSHGSDVLLKKAGDKYSAVVVSDKGLELITSYSSLFNEITKDKFPPDKDWKKIFEIEKAKSFLDKNFKHDYFQDRFLSCIGCGICTYTCPTCHCFDIQDEGDMKKGERIRNWDSCQFAIFTLHTSGHNPRTTQGDRYRQRLMHKFKIYSEKFDKYLCVGCGRCSRNCPQDINIKEVVRDLAELA